MFYILMLYVLKKDVWSLVRTEQFKANVSQSQAIYVTGNLIIKSGHADSRHRPVLQVRVTDENRFSFSGIDSPAAVGSAHKEIFGMNNRFKRPFHGVGG